ncbi:MAG: hypothetical protein JST12_12005 [Armatimonadetes bacterium]|nr:hypothetical protein [Armatimonadota bacterium]
MQKFRMVFAAFLALVLAGLSSAQVTPTKKGYLILIRYKKGQVLKYNIDMKLLGTTNSSSVQIVTKCLDVDKKGISTLEVSTPYGNKTNSRKLKVDRHGKPVGQVIDGFSGNFMWPETPIKIGQTWNGDFNLGADNPGAGMLKATYKLAAIKVVGGTKVAVVTTVIDYKGEYQVSGTGTINVRVSDGQLNDATFNVRMDQYTDSSKTGVMKLLMTIRTKS